MGNSPPQRSRKVDHFASYKKQQRSKTSNRKYIKYKPSVKKGRVSKRDRAKEMRALKKEYGLNRREISMIGAGHKEAPWEK